jgi:hypothetical protein
MTELEQSSAFLFYNSNDGKIRIQVILGDETVWTSQKGMAEIFEVDRVTITGHLQNIFKSSELQEDSVCRKILHTAEDGKKYMVNFYNLDAIIAVGYRVNSYRATQFRVWATRILKEYLIKGFVLDDERLKQGKKIFNKDYFDELIERIREIRASERRFYQKITDIYAECSSDYDKDSPLTDTFFKTVQNKLEFAITKHTAAEIVVQRASAQKPNMGLTSWKNEPTGGKILKSDVSVAKNYLSEQEIKELNIIVNMYLDYAELQATRHNIIPMADWIKKLDTFLNFNEYDILHDAGSMKADVAKHFAEKEYQKFRVQQDKEFESDFDKTVKEIKENQSLPKEDFVIEQKQPLSPFDQDLNTLIKTPPQKTPSEISEKDNTVL